MNAYIAPMQGHTEGVFCRAHHHLYGGADTYCTPFIRVEKGEVRRRDLKSINREFLDDTPVLPQAIFRDLNEFKLIADAVKREGYNALDLNLGCPFPPQVKHGRGAALLRNRELLIQLAEEIKQVGDMSFSIKMRLGVEQPDEWRGVVDVINAMPLEHVTIHPRVAVQQYGGELFIDQFEALAEALSHRVVYNGDLTAPEQIAGIIEKYPLLSGVMAGRGVMARPSLFAEWREGREWSREERIDKLIRLHREIYDQYRSTLCGDTQILMKIKPFWEYLEPEIGHKPMKAIKKATSLKKYDEAVRSIG